MQLEVHACFHLRQYKQLNMHKSKTKITMAMNNAKEKSRPFMTTSIKMRLFFTAIILAISFPQIKIRHSKTF